MALIKCHECDNEVSTEAAACQKCGAKPKINISPKKQIDATQIIAFVCLGIGLALAAGMEYLDFNRTFNAIVSLVVMGSLYGSFVKLIAAENVANSKKL